MEKHYTFLDIEINKPNYRKLRAVQFDNNSRYILVSVYSNYKPFNLTNTCINVYGIKKDKKVFLNSAKILDEENGKFEIDLTEQCLACSGEVEIQIFILGLDKTRLSSNSFILNVEKNIIDPLRVASADDWQLLNDGLSNLAEYNIYKNNVNKLDENLKPVLSTKARIVKNSDIEKLNNSLLNYNTIEFSENEFNFVNTLEIEKSIKFIGNNTTLKVENAGLEKLISIQNADEVVVDGIKFDANLKGRRLLAISNCKKITITNCKFTGYSKEFGYDKRDSAIFISNSNDISISNNTFFEFGYQYDNQTQNLNRCITIEGKDTVSKVNIFDNLFDKVNQAVVLDCNNAYITSNTFINVRDNAVYAFGSNININNNTFDTKYDEGIVIGGGDYAIYDNIFLDVPNKCIAFAGDLGTVKISDNVFKPVNSNSCFIFSREDSYNVKDLSIFNNTFKNLNNTSSYFLIKLCEVGKFNFYKNNLTISATRDQKIINFKGKIETGYFVDNIIQNMQDFNAFAFYYEPELEPKYFLIDNNILINTRIPRKSVFTVKNQILQSNASYILSPSNTDSSYSDNKPQTGIWKAGDFVRKFNPTSDGLYGWLCIESGEPGLWQKIYTNESYQERAGTPINWLNPRYIGDEFLDTSSKKWYKAVGLTTNDWVLITN